MNLLKYLQAAGVPETLQPEALASRVAPYKWSAPLVMALVVPWITWSLLRWKGE